MPGERWDCNKHQHSDGVGDDAGCHGGIVELKLRLPGWVQDDYVQTGCGMGREATLYLTQR